MSTGEWIKRLVRVWDVRLMPPSTDEDRRSGSRLDPGRPIGAVVYAVLAGLTVAVIIAVLNHVHVTWR